MITAFQIGAFQFTAFQEGALIAGSGGVRRMLLSRMRRRKQEQLRPSPTTEEIAELIAQARQRVALSFRAVPVVTNLAPVAEALAQRQDRIETEAFLQVLRDFVEVEEFIE